MLLQAIGAALPAALAVALSPFPVIGIVLILAGRHARRSGPLFALGWIVGLSVIVTLVVVVFSAADDPDSTTSAIADWSRVIVGGALIVLGVRTWGTRPRSGEEVPVPSWMSSLDDISAARAFSLGVVLSGVNPKNFVLTASASTSIIEAGVHDAELFVALAVFVLVGSCTVIGAVLVHFFGGQPGASLLDGVRQFMVANSVVITVIILLILGAKVLGDGLIGLGR